MCVNARTCAHSPLFLVSHSLPAAASPTSEFIEEGIELQSLSYRRELASNYSQAINTTSPVCVARLGALSMPAIMKGLFERLEVEGVRGWVWSPVSSTHGTQGRTWDGRRKALRSEVGWRIFTPTLTGTAPAVWIVVSSRALELDRRLDDLQEGNLPSGEVRQSSDLMPSDRSVPQGKIPRATTKTCCHQINT